MWIRARVWAMSCLESHVQQVLPGWALLTPLLHKEAKLIHKVGTNKTHDIERMTNFVRKKTFQSNLPFYNVEDEYLRNNEVNSAVSSAAHVSAILKLEVNTLEIQNTLLVNNNTDLKNETEFLKNANNKLEQTLKQTSDNLQLKCSRIENKLEEA